MLVHAILAAAALAVLLGCGPRPPEPRVHPVTPIHTPEPTVRSVLGETSSGPSPTHTPEPTVTSAAEGGATRVTVLDSTPEPFVQPLEDDGPDLRGFTTLEERIFHSDLIVRATLMSIEGRANLGCQAGNDWIPVIAYEFEALEYLQGMGSKSLSVSVPFGSLGSSSKSAYERYGSERDAIAASISHISERDDKWDEHEAIIFIDEKPWDSACTHPMYRVPPSNDSHSFTLAWQTYDVQAQEYRIESRVNRVWLPAVDVPPRKSESFFVSVPPREERKSITLDEVRQSIEELDRSISRAKYEGIFGYRECLASKYGRERWNQVVVDSGGRVIDHGPDSVVPPPQQRRILFSGLPSNKTVVGEVWQYASPPGSELRDRIWLTGSDAHLFQFQPDPVASESRMDSRGGLLHWIVPSSVLPAGVYRFQLHRQPAAFQPCDYHDELSAVDYFIEVLAPRETDQHYARYENYIMGSLGLLPSKMVEPLQDPTWVYIRIGSTSDCGSTQREDSRSQYQVVEVSSREEVQISVGSCPSIRTYLFEGIGPQGEPLHAFDTDDFREGTLQAELGVLPPGTYTVEVNVPQSEECLTSLILPSTQSKGEK